MSDRSAAILVDAGYVWKCIARAVGLEHRSDVDLIGYGVPLVEALVEEAEGDGMSVLRTYWYDGAPDRNPNVQQRAIGRTSGVKLRIGWLHHDRQKGVDRLLQKDILALASNRAVDDIIVLTGDQDMEEELDAAGQHGVLVHIWGISDRNQVHNISGRLLRIADEWRVLPADWAATFVLGEADDDSVPLANDAAVQALRDKLQGELGDEASFDGEGVSGDVQWGTAQYVSVGREAYDSLREQHGAEWPAIREGIAAKKWVRPGGGVVRNIPGRIDAELMDIAAAILGAELTDNQARIEIRDGFWGRFDEDSKAS